MLCNLKALCKYTGSVLTIFSLVDASSRLNQNKTWKFVEFLTGCNCTLKLLAQDNIEQNVIQFVALPCIMDKSSGFCTESDVQQCLKYPAETLSL